MIVLTLIRSLIFIAAMYLGMAVYALFWTIPTLIQRRQAVNAVRAYCAYVRWIARWIVGLKSEVRGPVPDGEVIIASKHQSFFDIIMIVGEVANGRFIMKKEILWTPIVGFYAKAIGCIPVDRGKRGAAVKKMVEDVREGRKEPGQLIIFPQGTRVAPGAYLPYKVGTGVIYQETGLTVVPVATNVGLFWGRRSLLRKPGLAVIEFLDPIEPGLGLQEFKEILEETVETASNTLMSEAGFEVADARD